MFIQRFFLGALCFSALCSTAVSAFAMDDAQVTTEERTQLLELMDTSREQYLGLIAGTNDAQWKWKPNPERWSVGECAEHILRSNEALFAAAKQALEAPANPEWREKTKGKADLLLTVMPNRRPMGAGGASAPMEIRPSGEPSRQSIIERFTRLYDEIEEFALNTEQPLKAHTTEHPFPVFNTLNAYQWVLYVPLHTVRHSRQMIEVMETEGYPSQ